MMYELVSGYVGRPIPLLFLSLLSHCMEDVVNDGAHDQLAHACACMPPCADVLPSVVLIGVVRWLAFATCGRDRPKRSGRLVTGASKPAVSVDREYSGKPRAVTAVGSDGILVKAWVMAGVPICNPSSAI